MIRHTKSASRFAASSNGTPDYTARAAGGVLVAVLACALSVGGFSPADAKTKAPAKVKPEAASPADAGGGKPLLAATFGDWGAYTTMSGKTKVCYALGQPKERLPSGLKRDPAFLFISRRTAEGVKNEISFGMGFDLKEGTTVGTAEVGSAKVDLVAKGPNAWVKNPAEETTLLDAMKKGSRLVVKAASKKNNVTSDSYSLNGLAQAWEKVLKDCP